MEAIGLLTRGRITPGYYPTLTVISWGFLYFRLPVFDVPGNFVPGFTVPVPLNLPCVPLTNRIGAYLSGDVVNQPNRLATTSFQILSNRTGPDLLPTTSIELNEASNSVNLISDDPSEVQLLNREGVDLAINEDSTLLTNDDDIVLLPQAEPDLIPEEKCR